MAIKITGDNLQYNDTAIVTLGAASFTLASAAAFTASAGVCITGSLTVNADNAGDQIQFNSNVEIDGNLTVLGTQTLGDAEADSLTVTGDASFANGLTASIGMLILDDQKLTFGTGLDASIEYDEDGTDQLRFALPAAGMVLAGTTPKLVIGDAGGEDTMLVFDGNAQDYRMGLDDGTDILEFGVGSAHGTTTSMKLDSSLNVDVAGHNGSVGLKLGGTLVSATAAELNYVDIATLGTAAASKALTIKGDSTWTVAGMTCADIGTVTTADINGGTIDGASIGAASHTTGKFTTCDATTDFTIDGLVLTADTITNDAALTVASAGLTLDSSGDIVLSADGDNITMDDGTTTVFDFDVADCVFKIHDDSQVANYATLTVTDHGATTLATVDADAEVAHLTLDADGDINLNPVAGGKVLIDGNVAIDAGVVTGCTSVTSTALAATNLKAADGTAAGSIASSTGVVTIASAVLTTADINAGAIDACVIGAATPLAGTFTDLTSTGTTTLGNAAGDVTTVTGKLTASNGLIVTGDAIFSDMSSSANADIKGSLTVGQDYGLTAAGAATIASMAGNWTNASRTVADLGTITTVDINGGTVDDATIGATTQSSVKATTLSGSSTLRVMGVATFGTNPWAPYVAIAVDGGLTIDHFDANWTNASRTVADLGTVTTVDINGGTVDGCNVTVGSGKTLDVSGGTLTTAAAQNLAIVQGVGANTDIGAYDLRAATLTADGLTAANVVFAGTAGVLSDDTGFTYNSTSNTLVAANVSGSTSVMAPRYMTHGGGAFQVDADADFLTFETGQATFASNVNVKANTFITYSDATLKKDIKPLDNALDKVMSMRGVSYEFKQGNDNAQAAAHREVGFLAQEMKQTVPEVVYGNGDGNLGIDYAKLTSVLVEAVKAQQNQIEELRAALLKK